MAMHPGERIHQSIEMGKEVNADDHGPTGHTRSVDTVCEVSGRESIGPLKASEKRGT
jgi:hypothetical protein